MKVTHKSFKKKILLVNPPVLSVLEPWYDAPDFPRTALACLAAYVVHKNPDIEVHCIDAKLDRLNFDETLQRILNHQPDYVGLTAFTNEIKPAAYLAGLIKRNDSTIITICGGAHITAIPEFTMNEFPTFDIGVIGEGEQTLSELLIALNIGKDMDAVKGIIYRSGNDLHKTSPRNRLLDLDDLPMPAWHLMPPAKEYFIQSERGCPFACIFCLNHNGKVARKRGVEKTLDEMEWLIDYGAKRISFGDELFSVDMVRAEKILDGIIERGIGLRVSWDIQTHVAFVNDNLFKKMKMANIAKCEMGVEAGDGETLKRMGKATNRKMIIDAFRLADKHNVVTGSFFILGQPNETYKTIWETIKLGISINPKEPIFGTMVPYPGTEVAKMAAEGKNGLKLVSTDWDEYRKQLNGSMELENISRTKLEWLQIFGFVIVFLANLRLLDFLKFFWIYRKGALKLLSKAISGKKTTTGLSENPKDYESVINSPFKLSKFDIITARESWKNYQSVEVQNAKRLKPELLKEQMPV
ncbi:MAG: B12-binding domain-containing radical SAM protein [Chitinophagales bacterium]|nr:B12-binding domain-containing radical SAM protein [Chitinophagales bacterium]